MLYLASPYTHPDPAVRQERFEAVCRVAGKLIRGGELVFSPIIQTHEIATRAAMDYTWEAWRAYDEQMLRLIAADGGSFGVLQLPGWRASVGMRDEQKLAEQLGMVIRYIVPLESASV